MKLRHLDERNKMMEPGNIADWGEFGHFRDFCNFWTRELHLNSSYGLGILRQPFRTMSCRKFGSKINVGMSGISLKFVIFLAS